MTDRKSFDFQRHLPSWPFVGAAALLVGGLAGAAIYAGVYNIAADAPHTKPVLWTIENLRDRSIAVRARGVTPPPDLASPTRIASGAGLYAEMCSSCHLAPGMEKTEISQGLYPQAPELSRVLNHSPAEEFWMIKHGIKMTAMPAWGRTHSDTLIWDLVAFIRTLPKMSPAQYAAAVKSAPADHDAMMQAMPGMKMPDQGPAKDAEARPHGH
ncbi:MAG: cytochrome c [Pseudomonadota bacterium]